MATQVTLNSGSVDSAGSLALKTNGTTTAVTIDTSQNVGIGTSSPTQKLSVQGAGRFNRNAVSTVGAVASSGLMIEGAGSNGNISQIGFGYDTTTLTYMPAAIYGITTTQSGNTAMDIAFATRSVTTDTAPSERMRIDTSGNVGIGTNSQATRLDVRYAGGAAGAAIRFGSASYGMGQLEEDSSFNAVIFKNTYSTSGVFTWKADTAERMRINSSGDLLVGTTDSSSNGVGFKVVGGRPTTATTGSTNSTTVYEAYSTGASAFRFYVGMAGTVFATSTTITAISDQRLKENIQDLDVGLDKIMALKPRKFDWKEGKGKNKKGDRGWIAQEFEKVFPDMIDEWRDPAPEGEEPYKAVNADLIPVLVKAIQEQQALIQTLTDRITALEAK